MFRINEDLTIECTRGDMAVFSVGANIDNMPYTFLDGQTVRFSVFEKKNCSNVVLQKDVMVRGDRETVQILLEGEDTRIGEVISKPVDYWYEVELTPETSPRTIIGYDENGAKVFRLYPESEV